MRTLVKLMLLVVSVVCDIFLMLSRSAADDAASSTVLSLTSES